MKELTRLERISETIRHIKVLKEKLKEDDNEIEKFKQRIIIIEQMKKATLAEIDKLEKYKKKLESKQ